MLKKLIVEYAGNGDIIKSINTCFKEFLANTVNLSQKDYENGRNSRNWLFNQISKFPERNLLKQMILFGKLENISRVFGVFEISSDRILIHSENQTPDTRETILIVLDIKRKKFEIVKKKNALLKK